IRGKRVGEALAILRFTNKRAASGIEKCLRSAIANATETAERQNVAVDPDELVVKTCFVDMGPTKHRRRVRPAPQGRAYREQRHFCHITILLSSETQEAEKADGKSAARPSASKRAKRGGAAAAPRAKRVAKVEADTAREATAGESKPQKRASKAASKLGAALRRKKKRSE